VPVTWVSEPVAALPVLVVSSGGGGGGGGGASLGLQTSLSSTLLPSWICSVLACAVAYEAFEPVG